MKIDRSEILPLGEYERVREHFRNRIIELKKRRRIQVSEDISLLFENHDTMLLQIQEMLRTERITNEKGIAHEIETYNMLVPGENELSASLFIEVPERERRDPMLERLCGIEEHVALEVDGEKCRATFEEGRRDRNRAAAVQYLTFPLTPKAKQAILAKKPVALVLDHPVLTTRVELRPDTVASLADDLG